MATRRDNKTRPGASQRRQTIDIASLYTEGFTDEIQGLQDPRKARLLVWTRQRAANAAQKEVFKVVGIAPVPRPGTKASTSKLNTTWRMADAVRRWEADPDIIYITSVAEDVFVEKFPGVYTGEVVQDASVPIWVAGPQDAIQENLIHQRVLPAGASQEQYDAWFDTVAITVDNYAQDAQFNSLVKQDKAQVKTKDAWEVVDLERINDLIWLANVLERTPKNVSILDVNGEFIGNYGEELIKAPTNVFTEWLLKHLAKDIDFSKKAIDISRLAMNLGAKVTETDIPDAKIAEGKYGGLKRRPLAVGITVTVTTDTGEKRSYEIPRNTIWTSQISSVTALFGEMNSVNNAKRTKVSYTYDPSHEQVREQVNGLLKYVKKKGAEDDEPKTSKTKKEYKADMIYTKK